MSDDRGWLVEFKASALVKNDALRFGVAVLRAVSSGKWWKLENSSGSNSVDWHGPISPGRRRVRFVFSSAGITRFNVHTSETCAKNWVDTPWAASIATTFENHIHRRCLFYLCPKVAECQGFDRGFSTGLNGFVLLILGSSIGPGKELF